MRAKIAPEDLKELILIKFGSLDNFAKKAGLNNSQVSVGLKQQTARFIAIVKKMGIKIETSDDGKNKVGSEESKNQIKNLVDRVTNLEKIINHPNALLNIQNKNEYL